MKKKFLLTLLAICISLFTFCLGASAAAGGFCGDSAIWMLDNGELTITGTGLIDDYSPSDSIYPPWYNYRSEVTSVVVQNGITNISSYAFADCTNLKNVTIPESITAIGLYAFSECTGIKNVYISDIAKWCAIDFAHYLSNPINFSKSLYLNNVPVSNLVIPDGVTSISFLAFHKCSSLTSVTIPSSVTSIGAYAFNLCSNIDKVYITDLAKWCTINFGDSFSNPILYSNNLYLNNNLITDLVIPSEITYISPYAFSNCISLTDVTIPSNITFIGRNAFHGCRNLRSVDIPGELTSIEQETFASCILLKNVTLPNSITSIKASAFLNCPALESINIPDGVSSIETNAFRSCPSLTRITLPGSITSLTYSSFGSSKVKVVVLEEGITELKNSPFASSNVEYVVIPKSMTSMESAFYECSKLSLVFYPGSEEDWNKISITKDDYIVNAKKIYNAEKHTYKLETNCENTIPDITDYAIFDSPSVARHGKKIVGWYDNSELSGEPVTFPYYGNAKTLYAKWENTIYTTTSHQTLPDGNTQFTVTPTDIPEGAVIVLALFNGNRLTDIQTAVNQNTVLNFTSGAPFTHARVMAWDSLSGMVPICDAEDI